MSALNLSGRALLCLVSFILTTGTGLSYAQNSVLAADQAHRGIIESYYSINSFYNYSANMADKKHKQLIDQSLAELDQLMLALAQENTAASQEAWQRYRALLVDNIEEVSATGYPDLRLAGDMAEANVALNKSLEQLYTELVKQSELDQGTASAHKASKTLALMMTKYSSRSTSTVSQLYLSDNAELTLDGLAADFEKQLKTLEHALGKNDEARTHLNAAQTKWDFIKDSYINYNENRVNFIVNLYSMKIIEDLAALVQN